jgi:hypothetical protein
VFFFVRRETCEWRYEKTPENDGLRYGNKDGKNDNYKKTKMLKNMTIKRRDG